MNMEDLTSRYTSHICCQTCGLDMRSRRCFDLKVKDVGDTTVEGICCGCGQEYHCGKVELSSCLDATIASGNFMDVSNVFDTSFDETAIRAASTPLNKQNQAKRNRKRRGSALERLLKEEDSETDRSLSGFLSMVSRQ